MMERGLDAGEGAAAQPLCAFCAFCGSNFFLPHRAPEYTE